MLCCMHEIVAALKYDAFSQAYFTHTVLYGSASNNWDESRGSNTSLVGQLFQESLL